MKSNTKKMMSNYQMINNNEIIMKKQQLVITDRTNIPAEIRKTDFSKSDAGG